MDLLRGRESTPADLNQVLRITGPVLTFHLRTLSQAGVVTQRRRGRQRVYRLNQHVLSPVLQWMRPYESRA
jgi:DNA-binding transcriptional ArsR family regulator